MTIGSFAVVLVAIGCGTPKPPLATSTPAITLAGTVVDSAGSPIAGAEVALVGELITTHVTSDRGGHFALAAVPARWGISAVAPDAVGSSLAITPYARDTRGLTIKLPRTGGVTVHGHVAERTRGTYLQIGPVGTNDADRFAIPVGTDGSFSAVLPRSDTYTVYVIEGGVGNFAKFDRAGDQVEIAYEMSIPAPPSTEVVDWVRTHAASLVSAEPGHGFDDMSPIGEIVGDAHVVGLGEATHGTHEFFQLKHRVVEYLVAKLGFTVFALETGNVRAVDEYVLHGTGTARAGVEAIPDWVWKTDETIALIEWIRAWNASPDHPAKVSFVGFDLEYSVESYKSITAYLSKVDPDDSGALLAPLALFSGPTWPAVDVQKKAKPMTVAAMAKLVETFERSRTAWIARTGLAAYDEARRALQLLDQASVYELFAEDDDSMESFAMRDRAMADNIAWFHDHQPAGTRMIVWAHNMHIANTYLWPGNMGSHLRAHFATDYRNFGMVFGYGTFNLHDTNKPTGPYLVPITLAPAPASHASTPFSLTKKPFLALDLHAVPATGPVHDWFARVRAVRDTGIDFSNEAAMTNLDALSTLYDGLLFIEHTTASHLLPGMASPVLAR